MAKRYGSTAGQLKSVRDIKKILRDAIPQGIKGTAKVLEEHGKSIQRRAFALTPYDPKPDNQPHLRDSLKYKVENRRGGVTLAITASATNPRNGYNYAGIQHDNLEYRHPHGGQAHYISQPYMEELPSIQKDIADLVAKQLVGGK